MRLDKKDKQILEILKKNAKLTTSKISKITSIPITTVHNRIKKLEKSGLIRAYTIVVNNKLIGKDVLVYILATVNYNLPGKVSQREIAEQINKDECVEEVCILTGENDLIVKARFSSIDKLNEFVTNRLRNIQGIDKTKTMVVLKEI